MHEADDDDEEEDRKPSAAESDDDDDDNWSRQVETDETTGALLPDESFVRMESVAEDLPAPTHPELTMKERLVLRERQRRIETERARLKQQFAMNNGADVDEEASSAASVHLGSVTEGTLGEESTRAHADDESAGEKLGFNMERFLRNSDSFNPQLEATAEEAPTTVMDRFLSEPVVVEQQTDEATTPVQRSVSFDVDGGQRAEQPTASVASYEDVASTNASVEVAADDDDVARDPLTPLQSLEGMSDGQQSDIPEPRVLRLTEADMQEMAAIEEASIGNAPPSEREEEMLSEIGELADFGGPTMNDPGTISQDTPTTAQESASMISGGNEARASDLDGIAGSPVSSSHSPRNDHNIPALRSASLDPLLSGPAPVEPNEEGLINRVMRPGMLHLRPAPAQPPSNLAQAPSSPAPGPVVVDDFDFDKHDEAPLSPHLGGTEGSYAELPDDPWSPAGKMAVSPIPVRRAAPMPSYYAPPTANLSNTVMSDPGEATPLLRVHDVPPEIIAQRTRSVSDQEMAPHHSRRLSIASAVDSVFSDVRSEEEVSKAEIMNESEYYLASNPFARAVPERLFALTVTLIFEIPVLLMISGGSDALCALIGRSRYQLLMGFIPLTSAISGNVGLQASTLTTRAISHCHVTTTSYMSWFLHEVGAAMYLGCGMGLLLGSIAFFASGMDFAFGLTILIAQFISIVTAGVTGTFAPLLFSFIFKRDSGKWGGPLETAIQDIVGSFAMVVISYQILKFLGPGTVDPSDMCGPGEAENVS